MKTRYRFGLQDWNDYQGTSITNLTFTNCTNLLNIKEEYANFISFTITSLSSTGFSITIYIVGSGSVTFTQANIGDLVDISAGAGEFGFDANATNINKVLTMYDNVLLNFNQDGRTTLITYKQNSKNIELDKDLTGYLIFDGKFNHSIALKTINIDVNQYYLKSGYNYVYIPSLNRYYYVDSVEIISADYVRLHLKEDVLSSWKLLIRNQDMYITRYQQSTEEFLIDDRFPFSSKVSVSYQALTPTGTGSLVNTTLKYDYQPADKCYLITTIATNENANDYGVSAPSGSGLPNISPRRNKNKHYYLLNYAEMGYFNVACLKDSATASFVVSALWLPFDLSATGSVTIANGRTMYAGDDMALTMNKEWHASHGGYTNVAVDEIDNGALPYFITQDFTFPDATSFLNYSPYTKVELYIAFIGWITLDMPTLFGKRCIVYYTLDAESGSSTCYLYNMTDKKVVFSNVCQFGIKMDFNTANFYQNNLQRTLLMIGSIVSAWQTGAKMGASAGKGDYGSVVSGIVGVGGNLASVPFKYALIQDSMTSNLGSSESSLYAPSDCVMRISSRDIISQDDFSDYYVMQGKPYNKYVSNILNLQGYLEVGEIHFNPMNNAIYQDEIEEIVSLLKNGVIV